MMADHEPGSMDIRSQEKAYAGLISLSGRVVVGVVVVLVLLALMNG